MLHVDVIVLEGEENIILAVQSKKFCLIWGCHDSIEMISVKHAMPQARTECHGIPRGGNG